MGPVRFRVSPNPNLSSLGVARVRVRAIQPVMAPLPKKLKPITAFIRRAEELDKVGDEQTQIIAYYCREYGECIEWG